MASVTLRGNPFNTNGELPSVGSDAPDFSLVGGDLGEITGSSLTAKKVVLNIGFAIRPSARRTSAAT